jgi:thiosulfate reductase cytochrome b subunit
MAVSQSTGLPLPASAGKTVSKARLVKKHPLAIRWQHWINFPVLFVMIWSGILILWSNPMYPTPNHALRVPDRISLYKWGVAPVYGDSPNIIHLARVPSFGPIPVPVFGNVSDPDNYPLPEARRYDIDTGFRLAEGMNWHFTFAWIFTLNGVAYVLFLAFSGEWRHLVPRRDSLREAFKVVLHDLGLHRAPLPPGKFNHAQRIAYTGVICLGMAMVVTGLAIYKPSQLSWLVRLLGGYQWARREHFLVTMLLLSFFFVHVAQVMRAGWNNFRAMITGMEVDRTGELTRAIEEAA